jgi:hypothetical protein
LSGTGKLIALFAFLALLLALLVRSGARGRSPGEAEALLFPKATEANATKIEIRPRGGTASVLEKTGETWGVTAAGGYPADPEAVNAIFTALAGIRASELVSKSAEKQALYEVDSAGTTVTVSGGDGRPLARFIVGKNGPDFQSSYVRPVDSEKVYLSSESLRSVVDRGRRGWRDRKILSFAPEDVVGMRLLSAGDTLALDKQPDGTWAVAGDASRVGRAPVLDGIHRTLARYITDEFADSVSADTVGLAPPERVIEVQVRTGPPEVLEIGKLKEERQYWVRRGGKPTIFIVSRARVDTVWRTREDLTEPKPPPPPADTTAGGAAAPDTAPKAAAPGH